MMNRYSAGLLILLASVVGITQARSTGSSGSSSSSSSASSSLAKGALIAIIVCVVVGVLICCLCTFCLVRLMRRRKAAKGTTGLPMTSSEKPVGSTTGDPYGHTGGGYGGQHAPTTENGAHQDYNPQAQPYGGQQDYTNNHQSEYNAAYNSGQQQQTYAPPPGPPGGITMPTASHY